MPRIELQMFIRAKPEVCFDCARDLDLHLDSFAHTGERIVAGRWSGLIALNEEVTWRARHFGLVHEHHSRIAAFDRPHHFRDEMVQGRFATFVHDHIFEAEDGGTNMRDILEFSSPFGVIGRIVDRWILTGYLRRLLEGRNEVIRLAAECRTR